MTFIFKLKLSSVDGQVPCEFQQTRIIQTKAIDGNHLWDLSGALTPFQTDA